MCGADIQLLRWIVHGGAFSMEECRRHCISSPPQSERHRRRGDYFGVTLGRNSAATFPPKVLHLGAPNVERNFHSAKLLLYAKSHLRSWRRKKHTHGCSVARCPAPPRAKVWKPIVAWRLGVVGCGRTLNPLYSVALLTPLDWRSGTNNRLTPEYNEPVLIRTTPAFRPPGFCTMVIMVIGMWYYRAANMSDRIIPTLTLTTLVHITDRRSDRRYDLVGIHG